MKICKECGIEKDLTAFSVDNKAKDNHWAKCKECMKIYFKEYRARNDQSEYDRKRNKTEHRINQRKKYLMSENERTARKIRKKVYYEKYPERILAHKAVHRAIKSGKLQKPPLCSLCESDKKLHGHHWSYEKENQLDVVWLCASCHNDVHRNKIELIQS